MKLKLLVAASALIAFDCCAGTLGDAFSAQGTVLSVNASAAWTRNDYTQQFLLQPEVEKKYDAADNNTNVAVGELFIGRQMQFNSWLGQLGLAVAQSSSINLDGDIWEDAEQDFNNFRYSYKVKHRYIAVKSKWLMLTSSGFLPYVSGSIGAGFNRASNFTITPKITEEVPAPPFADKRHTALSYTLGVGVQKAINDHWQTNIGYEFANWGKHSLGRAPGQTLNEGLMVDRFYTHALQLGVSYLI